MGAVVQLQKWGVYKFPWGSAVKEERAGKWTSVFIGGQEIDLTGIDAILHDKGVFLCLDTYDK